MRSGILEVSSKEEPYDIFICYKETDDKGDRTVDSLIAQDVYDALTEKGYRVFFSRISLEDKLGQEYEPYIFAALHSAKIMLVFGTSYDNFNAVWVKNEWSRYLSLIAKGEKKTLIPCYKDVDAYDMPQEFRKLQAQDMGKVGATQDLLRGIEKILPLEKEKNASTDNAKSSQQSIVDPLLKRAFLFLEDGNWEKADEYCEKALDFDPKNAEAYLGKLMVELRVKTRNSLKDQAEPFADRSSFQKAMRFGDERLKVELESDIDYIKNQNNTQHLTDMYHNAVAAMGDDDMETAFNIFKSIPGFKDADILAQQCAKHVKLVHEKAERVLRVIHYNIPEYGKPSLEQQYIAAKEHQNRINELLTHFDSIQSQIVHCITEIEKLTQETVQLQKTRSTLGFFAGKEKKRIDFELAEKDRQLKQLQANQETLQQKLCGYNSFEDISQAKTTVDATVFQLEQSREGSYTYQQAMDLLRRDKALMKAAYQLDQNLTNRIQETRLQNHITASPSFSIGVKKNGTVLTTKYIGETENDYGQCNVSGWKDIVSVSAGESHIVGLRSDGTAVAVGNNAQGQCNVSGWNNIVAITAGVSHTIGLKKDGTVVAAGNNGYGQCSVSGWTDIIAIAAGWDYTVGLKADGTVVAVGDNEYGQCNVAGWVDIIGIAAGSAHTVGLKSDGTAIAVGYNGDYECNLSNWSDIIAVAAGHQHTIGLKSDGSVVAVGSNKYTQCSTSGWKDIVAIAAGHQHTIGLKPDGSVIAIGYNVDGQCNVSEWRDIKVY